MWFYCYYYRYCYYFSILFYYFIFLWKIKNFDNHIVLPILKNLLIHLIFTHIKKILKFGVSKLWLVGDVGVNSRLTKSILFDSFSYNKKKY